MASTLVPGREKRHRFEHRPLMQDVFIQSVPFTLFCSIFPFCSLILLIEMSLGKIHVGLPSILSVHELMNRPSLSETRQTR